MHAFVSQEHGVFTPDGKQDMTPEQAAEHNRHVTEAEWAYWQTRPALFAPAYYDTTKGTVTTWTGLVLGTIASSRVWRHNFGGRMISIRVQGNNGAAYYGTASYDWGTVITLRKTK